MPRDAIIQVDARVNAGRKLEAVSTGVCWNSAALSIAALISAGSRKIVRKFHAEWRKNLRVIGQAAMASDRLDHGGQRVAVATVVHLGGSCAGAKKECGPQFPLPMVSKTALNAEAKRSDSSDKGNGHDGDRQPKEQVGPLGAVPAPDVLDVVLLPAIWLFFNDCIVAPAKLTPVALPEIVAPPIHTVAAVPDATTPVPKLFTTLVPAISKLRTAVAIARTPSPPLVATIPPCTPTSIGPR